MASNNDRWATEHVNARKGGRHDVDIFTMLASKVDALFQKEDRLQTNPSYGSTSSNSFGHENVCEVCRIQGHVEGECQLSHSFQDVTIE